MKLLMLLLACLWTAPVPVGPEVSDITMVWILMSLAPRARLARARRTFRLNDDDDDDDDDDGLKSILSITLV